MKLDEVAALDVVIDTNVLCHSEQTAVATHESAAAVVTWLAQATDCRWVLDDQGKSAPDLRTSVLASEYQATLSPQGWLLTFFAACLANGRVTFAPRPGQTASRTIRQLVPRNTRDRAVLGAAAGSESRVLVSNDYTDFHVHARVEALAKLNVHVLDSEEAIA